jgi:hypothetical protein
MKRLVLLLAISLALPLGEGIAQPATPNVETVDDSAYRGQIQLAQLLIVSIIPSLEEIQTSKGNVFTVMGVIETLRLLENYFSITEPPLAYAEEHQRVERALSAAVIGGDFVIEGIDNDQNSSVTIGLMAMQESAPFLEEAITELASAIGLDPVTPMPRDTIYDDGPAPPRPTTESTSTNLGPQKFSGFGDEIIEGVRFEVGLLRVAAMNNGDRNFVVWLYGPDGDRNLLFNEIGSYSGERATQIRVAGIYTIAVESSGSWSLSLSQ